MRTFKYAVATVVLTTSVGCGGPRTAELESELAACKENRTVVAAETEKVQATNAELQAGADEIAKVAQRRKQMHDDFQAGLLPMIDARTLSLSMRNGLVTITIPAEPLFKGASSTLTKEGKQTLIDVAALLKHFGEDRFMIAVHTDSRSVKDKRARAKDNWDFTTQQAYQVYQILSAAGVGHENLVVAGFGAADPVGDNANEAGQASNRRLEIVAMPRSEAILPAAAQAHP